MEKNRTEAGNNNKKSVSREDADDLGPTGPFSVLLLGQFGAGKTSLAELISPAQVSEEAQRTRAPRPTRLVEPANGPRVLLDIVDTGGEEKHTNRLTATYFRNVHALILVYSVANAKSLHHLQAWHRLWREYMGKDNMAPVIAVGTKNDLPQKKHTADTSAILSWCAATGIQHFVASAVTGSGVEELLHGLAVALHIQYGVMNTHKQVFIGNPMCERTGCCCLLLGPTDDEHVEWLSHKLARSVFCSSYSNEQPPIGDNTSAASALSSELQAVDSRSQLTVSGVRYELSVDLIASGRAYVEFLAKAEELLTIRLLSRSDRVEQAMDRYAKFVRLARLFPDHDLWTLPDIEFVWKSHLIRPLAYAQEMKAIFGPRHTLSHSALTAGKDGAAALRHTSALWSQLYAGESYVPDWLTPDLLAPFLSASNDARTSAVHSGGQAYGHDAALVKEEAIGADMPSWEAVRSGITSLTAKLVMEDANWMPYLKNYLKADTTEEVVEETRLQACLDGYGRFLTGKKALQQEGDEDDEDAPYDVDIMWHAHMLHPEAYWYDCAQMGLALNHRPWPHLYQQSSSA